MFLSVPLFLVLFFSFLLSIFYPLPLLLSSSSSILSISYLLFLFLSSPSDW
jgi:hypothetical protein